MDTLERIKGREREIGYAPPLVCETVSVLMSLAFESLSLKEACERRHQSGRHAFHGTKTFKRLTSHAELFGDMPLEPEVFQSHMHSYICVGSDIVKKRVTQEVGLLAIPVPSEDDIKLLTERIQASEWNMQNIQEILFSSNLDFTQDQVWDLAGVIAERKEKHDIENPRPRSV